MRHGIGALAVFLLMSAAAWAWNAGPDRDVNRDSWRLTTADQANDHGFMAVRAIQALAGRASYGDAVTYANDIKFGVWFEDQIGLPDQGTTPTAIDTMTIRLMQTNHYLTPSLSPVVLQALYTHITQSTTMRDRGVFGSRCVTMLGPNAYTYVASGALVRAHILYGAALLAARAGNLHTAWWLVGRAYHYVQDMTQPNHDVSASVTDPAMRAGNGLICSHLGTDLYTTGSCHWVIEMNVANRTLPQGRPSIVTLDPETAGYQATRRALFRGGTTMQQVTDRAADWHAKSASIGSQQQCYDLAQNTLFPCAIKYGASLFDAFYRAYHR